MRCLRRLRTRSGTRLAMTTKDRASCKGPALRMTKALWKGKQNDLHSATQKQFLPRSRESPHGISAPAYDRNFEKQGSSLRGLLGRGSLPRVRLRCWNSHPKLTSPVEVPKSFEHTYRYSRGNLYTPDATPARLPAPVSPISGVSFVSVLLPGLVPHRFRPFHPSLGI